mgnify:CR=1 FL=1
MQTATNESVPNRRPRRGSDTKYYVRDLALPFIRQSGYCEFACIEDAADFCVVDSWTAKAHLSRKSRTALNGRYIIRSQEAELFGEEEFVIPFNKVTFSVKVGDTVDLANLSSIPELKRALGKKYSTLFLRFLCEAASETPNVAMTMAAPCGVDVTITVVTPTIANYSAVAQVNADMWRRGVKSTQLDGVECRYSYAAFSVLSEWKARVPKPTVVQVAQFLEDNRPWFEGKQTGSWWILDHKITVISSPANAEGPDDV